MRVLLSAAVRPPPARLQRASPSLQRRGIKGVVIMFRDKLFIRRKIRRVKFRILNIVVIRYKIKNVICSLQKVLDITDRIHIRPHLKSVPQNKF